MTEKVRYEVEDGIAVVTIARPEVRNAIDRDVFDGLRTTGERAAADPVVRGVVVVGEGEAFSSGIDVSIFSSGGFGDFDPTTLDVAGFQRSFTVFEEAPKPTIAAVSGPAFGAGLQLALACDLRVVADDVRFSVMEIRWGIIPDLGGTQRLPRVIGLGRAKEMALTARFVEADEALAWGLANRVVPAGEHRKAAVEWAREIAAGPPLTLAAIKRLAQTAFDAPVATGLEREAMTQRRVMATEDFKEAVASRLEKRAPVYRWR